MQQRARIWRTFCSAASLLKFKIPVRFLAEQLNAVNHHTCPEIGLDYYSISNSFSGSPLGLHPSGCARIYAISALCLAILPIHFWTSALLIEKLKGRLLGQEWTSVSSRSCASTSFTWTPPAPPGCVQKLIRQDTRQMASAHMIIRSPLCQWRIHSSSNCWEFLHPLIRFESTRGIPESLRIGGTTWEKKTGGIFSKTWRKLTFEFFEQSTSVYVQKPLLHKLRFLTHF